MANGFNTSLNKEAEAIQEEEEKQVQLHNRHKDVDKDKVIIERSPFDTFMSVLASIIRVIVFIVLGALAIIGVLAVILPESRAVLIDLWINTLGEISRYLGG